jgi:hypothetical protein
LLRVKRVVGTILIAAAVGIGALTFRAAVGARARVEETVRAEAAQQVAAREAELRAVEGKARAAADLPALNAALSAHVDSATIVDLLDSE